MDNNIIYGPVIVHPNTMQIVTLSYAFDEDEFKVQIAPYSKDAILSMNRESIKTSTKFSDLFNKSGDRVVLNPKNNPLKLYIPGVYRFVYTGPSDDPDVGIDDLDNAISINYNINVGDM